MLEILTIIAIFAGPLSALLVSMWVEKRRKGKDYKLAVLQNFLSSLGRTTDPLYSSSARQIPIAYDGSSDVLKAFREWSKATNIDANRQPTSSEIDDLNYRQRTLINQMLRDLGFAQLTADSVSQFTARGLAERDHLIDEALKAIVSIAGQEKYDTSKHSLPMAIMPQSDYLPQSK